MPDKDCSHAQRIIDRHEWLLPDKKDYCQAGRIIALPEGFLPGTDYCQARRIISRQEGLLPGTKIRKLSKNLHYFLPQNFKSYSFTNVWFLDFRIWTKCRKPVNLRGQYHYYYLFNDGSIKAHDIDYNENVTVNMDFGEGEVQWL